MVHEPLAVPETFRTCEVKRIFIRPRCLLSDLAHGDTGTPVT